MTILRSIGFLARDRVGDLQKFEPVCTDSHCFSSVHIRGFRCVSASAPVLACSWAARFLGLISASSAPAGFADCSSGSQNSARPRLSERRPRRSLTPSNSPRKRLRRSRHVPSRLGLVPAQSRKSFAAVSGDRCRERDLKMVFAVIGSATSSAGKRCG
jgi:hypothetical protein